tara:strand:+ start:15361 stop:15798 length:438 start_codon:yes stop_codon:yes gene_type:complete
MDIRKIKSLIEMLQESDLREIEVTEGEESVRISRGLPNEDISVTTGTAGSDIQETSKSDNTEKSKVLEGNIITSPIVGTFYRKPAPDRPPYVEVGDNVQEGQVVCIVEAMKMMNEIKSEYSGKVVAIPNEDAAPVEFGQTLIVIK